MGLIIREFIGWILTVLGLLLIGLIVQLALDRSVLEAAALSLPSAVVFRAGISLVKLGAAGRIAARLPRDPLAERRSDRNSRTESV